MSETCDLELHRVGDGSSFYCDRTAGHDLFKVNGSEKLWQHSNSFAQLAWRVENGVTYSHRWTSSGDRESETFNDPVTQTFKTDSVTFSRIRIGSNEDMAVPDNIQTFGDEVVVLGGEGQMSLSDAHEALMNEATMWKSGDDILKEIDAFSPTTVIERWGLRFSLGSAVQHIYDAADNEEGDEIAHLRKAKWFLEHRIAQLTDDGVT